MHCDVFFRNGSKDLLNNWKGTLNQLTNTLNQLNKYFKTIEEEKYVQTIENLILSWVETYVGERKCIPGKANIGKRH